MTFRKSFPLKITPVVLVMLGLLGWVLVGPAHVSSGVLVYIVFAGITWPLWAQAQYSHKLEITDTALMVQGYRGGPIIIFKSDVMQCRYILIKPYGRYKLNSFFIEIRSRDGNGIRVSRYGWGSQRRTLFGALSDWLEGAQVALDGRTRAFLAAASR